jgi:hypothetical protein
VPEGRGPVVLPWIISLAIAWGSTFSGLDAASPAAVVEEEAAGLANGGED